MLTHFRLGMFGLFLALHVVDGQLWAETSAAPSVDTKRSIPYKSLENGKNLLADVYLPETKESPRPTLLMIHGGAWFSGNKVHVAYHANYAAEQGYAVVAINYRLAPQFKFPAQLEDCRDALVWIAEHAQEYGFDPKRVGVYGYSAGAQLACLVGMGQNQRRDPAEEQAAIPRIRAIVAGGAPCEFSWIPDGAETLAFWLGSSRDVNPDVYAAASPLEFVDANDPPVFLFHGTEDRIVPLLSPKKMEASLSEAEVVHEFHQVDRASHFGAFIDKNARKQAVRFLDKHLRD